MTLAIIKSPAFAGKKAQIGLAALPEHVVAAPVVDTQAIERQQMESRVRDCLEKEFQAKFDAEREKAYEQGYKEGLEGGHQEGVSSGAEGFKKQTQLLEQVIAKVEESLDIWLGRCQEVATELAFESLTRVLGEQVLAPQVIAGMVQQVMAPLRESDVLTIRLHPSECAALRMALRQCAVGGLVPARVLDKLQDDATLQSGGCVIETPRGEYRAPLDIQLNRLRQLMDAQRAPVDGSTESMRDVLCA
ncbi:MAG: FliH/SctL family protein [Pseudomonadota bacterium]